MPRNAEEEKLNPCLREQRLTYKCLSNNNYDKELCQRAINNYKTCKKFWNFVKSERRRMGVTPNLPDVEDRERIKAEYLGRA